jgi:thiol-disulfide isomerase/thioredoxin
MFNALRNIILSLLFIFLFFPLQNAHAQDISPNSNKEINIYFFWGEGCPHCAKEKPFLEKLKQKYPQIKIHSYEVWKNSQNRDLMVKFDKKLNININGVPITIIGEKYFTGWLNESYTGARIEDAVKCAINEGCRDVGMEIFSQQSDDKHRTKQIKLPTALDKIPVPILGQIDIKKYSLPIVTIILGTLDGFNPCAMWTLLFLISLLLGMENKKRMWILGSAFIISSASVYFLFMSAWLNLIMFIGMIVWVRVTIGFVALIGGGYNLREYVTNKNASCKVTGSEKRQRIFKKLKNITQQRNFYLALFGIIILAFAVNLVELICSAGIPAVFTQILALNDLASWQYYLYILLYIFFFMLDDLLVFFVAMITLRTTGITTKYSNYSHVIGGVLMLIIGILLLFKPEWLMFG